MTGGSYVYRSVMAGRHRKQREAVSRRGRRAATAVVVGTSCAGVVAGLGTTANAAVPSKQTLDAPPSSVARGTTVTFSGDLTGMSDMAIAGETVKLESRTSGGDWQAVASAKTDRSGHVGIAASVGSTSQWRLDYGGDGINDPDVSPARTVHAQKPINQRIVDIAAAQKGKPYAYGADGPGSFDCSGLTRYVHKQVGIDLPHNAAQQADSVKHVSKQDMRPGDLVFFSDGGQPYHVGIYAGNGKIWDAPHSGEKVQLRTIWTDSYTVGRAW